MAGHVGRNLVSKIDMSVERRGPPREIIPLPRHPTVSTASPSRQRKVRSGFGRDDIARRERDQIALGILLSDRFLQGHTRNDVSQARQRSPCPDTETTASSHRDREAGNSLRPFTPNRIPADARTLCIAERKAVSRGDSSSDGRARSWSPRKSSRASRWLAPNQIRISDKRRVACPATKRCGSTTRRSHHEQPGDQVKQGQQGRRQRRGAPAHRIAADSNTNMKAVKMGLYSLGQQHQRCEQMTSPHAPDLPIWRRSTNYSRWRQPPPRQRPRSHTELHRSSKAHVKADWNRPQSRAETALPA